MTAAGVSPRPAEVGEAGQRWTVGDCWLYCEASGIPVMWVGAASCLGLHAPLMACPDCLHRLAGKIRARAHHRDLGRPA